MNACANAETRPKTKYASPRCVSSQFGGRPSAPTLVRMVERGEIPGAFRIGRMVMIPQVWVDSLITNKPDFLA